jgi:hypothetical protein
MGGPDHLLRFHVLGPVRVWRQAEPVDLGPIQPTRGAGSPLAQREQAGRLDPQGLALRRLTSGTRRIRIHGVSVLRTRQSTKLWEPCWFAFDLVAKQRGVTPLYQDDALKTGRPIMPCKTYQSTQPAHLFSSERR